MFKKAMVNNKTTDRQSFLNSVVKAFDLGNNSISRNKKNNMKMQKVNNATVNDIFWLNGTDGNSTRNIQRNNAPRNAPLNNVPRNALRNAQRNNAPRNNAPRNNAPRNAPRNAPHNTPTQNNNFRKSINVLDNRMSNQFNINKLTTNNRTNNHTNNRTNNHANNHANNHTNNTNRNNKQNVDDFLATLELNNNKMNNLELNNIKLNLNTNNKNLNNLLNLSNLNNNNNNNNNNNKSNTVQLKNIMYQYGTLLNHLNKRRNSVINGINGTRINANRKDLKKILVKIHYYLKKLNEVFAQQPNVRKEKIKEIINEMNSNKLLTNYSNLILNNKSLNKLSSENVEETIQNISNSNSNINSRKSNSNSNAKTPYRTSNYIQNSLKRQNNTLNIKNANNNLNKLLKQHIK